MSSERVRAPVVLALAAVTFVACCTVAVGGFLDARPWHDPKVYEAYASRMAAGELPYADFYFEYPPGAVPVFFLPRLVAAVPGVDYLLALRLLMAACGLASLVCVYIVMRILEAGRTRLALGLFSVAIAPAALGAAFLSRYDAWPAFLTVVALLALLVRRQLAASTVLALGTAAKVFSAAAAPVAALRIARVDGPRQTGLAAAAFGLVLLASSAAFLVVGPGGLRYSFWTQANRPLHIESLGGSLLLVLDQLGLYRAQEKAGLAVGLDGPTADALGLGSSLLQIAAIAGAAMLYRRRPEGAARLVAAFVTAIAAVVVLGKVLSPQFLVWLVPLVPLVGWRRPFVAVGLFIGALVLTQLEYEYGSSEGMELSGWAVWMLAARNVALVALLVMLFAEVARPSRPGVIPAS